MTDFDINFAISEAMAQSRDGAEYCCEQTFDVDAPVRAPTLARAAAASSGRARVFPTATDWFAYLATDAKGQPDPNNSINWVLLLEFHSDMEGVICFNEFSGETTLVRCPPWEHASSFKPRAINDNDYPNAVLWLLAHGFKPKVTTLAPFIGVVADRHRFHPVKDYLNSLPAWDCIKRVDSLLPHYLGAENNRLNRAFSRKWLCAIVRRVFEPGTKFDHVLTLQGAQGQGKSTFGKALIPEGMEHWFSDAVTVGDKAREVIEHTRGRLIVELPELAGRSSRDIDAIKKFISATEDTARGAYGRTVSTVPRQFVFYATVNPAEFLTDSKREFRRTF